MNAREALAEAEAQMCTTPWGRESLVVLRRVVDRRPAPGEGDSLGAERSRKLGACQRRVPRSFCEGVFWTQAVSGRRQVSDLVLSDCV